MLVDLAMAIGAKQKYWRNFLQRQNVIGIGVGYKTTASGPTVQSHGRLSIPMEVAQGLDPSRHVLFDT